MAAEDSLTLAVAHNIASEHNGFFSASSTGADICLEVLLPRWRELEAVPDPAQAAATPTVLLVEPREMVRAELHKFFEANGINLLEAADAAEAIALAEVREDPLDVVIAPSLMSPGGELDGSTADEAGEIYRRVHVLLRVGIDRIVIRRIEILIPKVGHIRRV